MQRLHTGAAAHNPQVYAYIDTVEVFYPRHRLTTHADALLKRIGCRECKRRHEWGYRYRLNYPFTEETLVKLDWITEKYSGILIRFDPALDIQTISPKYFMARILQTA